MKKGPRGVTAMLPSAAVIFSLTVRGAGCSPSKTSRTEHRPSALLLIAVNSTTHWQPSARL